jgi:hypothetical protein
VKFIREIRVEVAALFDELWVGGLPGIIPGAADPTYSFSWALRQIENNSPELLKAQPNFTGFGYLPYAGIYDSELLTNNVSDVKNN